MKLGKCVRLEVFRGAMLAIAFLAMGEFSFAAGLLQERLQGARSQGQLAGGQLVQIAPDDNTTECPGGTHKVMNPNSANSSGSFGWVCVQDGREDICNNAGFSGNGYTSCLLSVGDVVPDTSGLGKSTCSEYQSLVQACANQYTSTNSSCDASKDSGMNKVSSTASQLSLAFGQQSASSIQAACSGVGQVSTAANAALAGFRLTCSNAIKKCGDSCSEVVSYLKANPSCDPNSTELSAAQAEVTKCSQFDAKINEANQAMMNVAQTLNNASQCASLTASGETPSICKNNPNLPGCTASGLMDCTNPAMASNKVCICTKNPSDPSCSANIQGLSGGTSLGSSDPSARLGNKNATASGEDTPGLDPIAQGQAGSADYSSGAVSGKQGGGANLGGGSGGSSGGGSRGGYAADGTAGHAVNAGFYGGGGGGSGFSGSGGGYGGGGYAGSGSSTSGQNGAPNLRQFLPGGQNDPRSRGVAGSSGPDGITGPHSNIWQKVNNRYRTVVPTLLP